MSTTATRKFVDCSKMPSEKGCSVYISGTEDEVLEAAVAHAVDAHGHSDSPELRAMIKAGMGTEV